MSASSRGLAIWWAGAGALAALVALYLAPVFGPGALVAGDHPFHLAVAGAADRTLAAHRLVAWVPDLFAGYAVFSPLVPAPLGYAGVVLLGRVVGLGLAYKVVVLLSVLLPALAVWTLLARRLSPAAAFAGANLVLLATYHLVQPLEGLWGPYLGLGLVVLGIAALDPVGAPGRGRAAGAAVAFAAAGLTDPVTWAVLVALAPLLVVAAARAAGRRGAALVAGALGVGLGTVGAWLVVVLAGQAGSGLPLATPAGGIPGLLSRLPAWFLVPADARTLTDEVLPALLGGETREALALTGRVALAHLAEAALLGAAAVALARRLRGAASPLERQVLAATAVAALLVLAPWQWIGATGWLPALAAFAPERFVPYVNVGLAALAACALHGLRPSGARARAAALALGALALVALHGTRYATYADHVALKTASASAIHAELADVWQWVRHHADPRRSRVLYQELDAVGFLDGGTTNLAALSARETGVAAVSTQPVRYHVALRRPGAPAADRPLGSVASVRAFMTRLNCDLLVLWHPGIRQALVAAGAGEVVHESPQRLFAVVRLAGYEPRWIEFDRAVDALETTAVGAERLGFRLGNPAAGTRALLKVAYHPAWSARVNGQPRTVAERGALIAVDDLPPGPVTLEFVFGDGPRAP